MSDWDPNWQEFLKSLEDDSASVSSPPPSAASVAAPNGVPIPTSAASVAAPNGVPIPTSAASVAAPHGVPIPTSAASVAAPHGVPIPTSAASVAAPHGVPIPTSDEALRRLKDYINEYLVALELNDLSSLFLEEAEKNAGFPPVPFVETWVRLESQMIPCSAPQCDMLAAMLALNEGVEKYLDHLGLDTRSFKEKAWRHAVRRIPLIEIWMDRIHPKIDAGYPGRDLPDHMRQ